MTVLVTGFSGVQVKPRPITGARVQTNVDLLVGAFRTAGAEVDWRPVELGEDLSSYSRVFVFPTEGETWTPRFLYGGLWTLASRPDATIAFHDFGISALLDSYRNERGVFRKPDSKFRVGGEKIEEYRPRLEPVVRALAAHDVPWSLLVSAFDWGDRSLLGLPSAPRVDYYDPTPLAPEPIVAEPDSIRPRWVLGSLQKHGVEEFVEKVRSKSKWEVAWYHGRLGAPTRLTERRLLDEYVCSSGILSQPRANDRSGWWRMRNVHARRFRKPIFPESWSDRPRTLEEIEAAPWETARSQTKEWSTWSHLRLFRWATDYLGGAR